MSADPPTFEESFGEPLAQVIDIQTWSQGANLAQHYDRMREEVAASVSQERRTRQPIRDHIFPRLKERQSGRPANAGVYQVSVDEIAAIHTELLFNGGVEACDGTLAAHDSLLLSVVQIGLSLVAYQGSQGTWVQRLYQRDMRAHHPDPVEEMMRLLEQRGGDGEVKASAGLLVRRALMEYAERVALLRLSTAPWRMGHGNPVAITILGGVLSGPGMSELIHAGMLALRQLVLGHQKFVYVVSEPTDRLLLTIGDALNEREFAIVDTLSHQMSGLERAQNRAGNIHPTVPAMMQEIGPEVVTGVYRASNHAPARIFYAHKDHACEAAAIAIADSVLQPYRGFPMLIDLADLVCGNVFDGASFRSSLHNAYAASGEPTRFLGERETRS